MPCDNFQLLHDYARLCVKLPGDPYRTAQCLLGHLSQSLNLSYAAFLVLDAQGLLITRACGTSTAPGWLLSPQPLSGTPWQELVNEERSGQVEHHWVYPTRGKHGLCGLLVCGLGDGIEFCEADGTVASAVSTSLAGLLCAPEDIASQPDMEAGSGGRESHVRQLREFRLLYRISRALHSTLNLDELTHLVLSAAVLPEGAGFERAMLFTANEKTGVLQGMLGVSRDAAVEALSVGTEDLILDIPHLGLDVIEAQRATLLNRKVIKQRLLLNAEDNALAKAYLSRQVVLVPHPDNGEASSARLARELDLGPYACAPLSGRDRALGVLLVDNPVSREQITPACLWFLELFASQAGAALENARLVQRLERAHEDLREVQERLIQGEKLAVLGEMAAQVAHELKNPLVSIGGFAQRLERQDLGDPRSNEYSSIIAREVRRMEEMLGNILAFSKKQLVCLDECSLLEMLSEVLELEMDHFQRLGIDFEQHISEPVPRIVGDCRLLRQVLLNLLVNARQAMPQGGKIMVKIARCILRGEEAVEVEVEDTGGGIPSEMIRNIFNPFFSTNPKGTGLGLSISHRIIEHHYGELEVVNGEQGARFIVRLPVHPALAVSR
ncbi:MAG: GAF domain-containing protein [Desulfuromonadales bacterium]|nr:GAF domain-containing protein [Desulfuromonadales bacterium]